MNKGLLFSKAPVVNVPATVTNQWSGSEKRRLGETQKTKANLATVTDEEKETMLKEKKKTKTLCVHLPSTTDGQKDELKYT